MARMLTRAENLVSNFSNLLERIIWKHQLAKSIMGAFCADQGIMEDYGSEIMEVKGKRSQ